MIYTKFIKRLAFVSNLSYSDIRKRRERSINAAASSFFFYTQKAKTFCGKLKLYVYQGPAYTMKKKFKRRSRNEQIKYCNQKSCSDNG